MTTIAILLHALAITAMDNQGIDKTSFRQALEAVVVPLEDITCEYEGTMVFPQGQGLVKLGPGGLYDEYSGSYIGRHDGAVLVDIYHRQYPKRELLRETIAMIRGKCEQYSRFMDRPPGGGAISPADFSRIDVMGSLGRIYCQSGLVGYLTNDEWTMSSDVSDSLDSHPCRIVTFSYKKDPSLSEKFWVDLERGGNVLKRESLRGGKVSHRMEALVLETWKSSAQERVWIPVGGTYASFMYEGSSGEPLFGDAPTNLEKYNVLRSSVRINTGPKDDRFSVRFRNGTVVTDKLRRIRFEFGQTRSDEGRLSQRQVESMLSEQVAAAEAQGKELKAMSWETSKGGRLGWVFWAVATVFILVAVTIIVRFVQGRFAFSARGIG